MPLIAWTDEYSVNIREIDNQHRRWFAILNKLFDAKGSHQERESLNVILSELVKYTETHFVNEERLMKAHDYPDLASHIKEHEAFIQKVSDFQQRFEDGKAGLDISVLSFLMNWFKNHIQVSDKAYAPFLNEKGVK